jgi:hypothetical protein
MLKLISRFRVMAILITYCNSVFPQILFLPHLCQEAGLSACSSLLAGCLFGVSFDPEEDRGSTFLQDVTKLLPHYTVSRPKVQ